MKRIQKLNLSVKTASWKSSKGIATAMRFNRELE